MARGRGATPALGLCDLSVPMAPLRQILANLSRIFTGTLMWGRAGIFNLCSVFPNWEDQFSLQASGIEEWSPKTSGVKILLVGLRVYFWRKFNFTKVQNLRRLLIQVVFSRNQCKSIDISLFTMHCILIHRWMKKKYFKH